MATQPDSQVVSGEAFAETGPLGPPYPIDARVNDAGHLEIGGCDVLEVAAEFGTPSYIYAAGDLRSRANAAVAAFRDAETKFGDGSAEEPGVLFASKSFPCTAAYQLMAAEGIYCDVASGGELHLALKGGFAPERILMHGNNKTEAELQQAIDAGVGYIVIDSFDEIDRLANRMPDDGPRTLVRVAPGIKPSTHAYIQTGQVDSKFGIPLSQVEQAIQKAPNFVGLHCHLGSQFFEVEIFKAAVDVLAGFEVECKVVNVGGGFGIPYLEHEHPPPIDNYAWQITSAVRESFGLGTKIMVEPGRWLVGNAGVTAYTVGTVKEIPGVRRYVAVDGGMSDNIRPMLYDAEYTGLIADRAASKPDRDVRVVGMHCESGDVILPEVMLDEPTVGDTLVVPATGAYGHAMASNYNGVLRPPVVFCEGGEARIVVRRETHEDLSARDVE
ncbi:MAG: diaminopimelate decarboxylase [Thermoleophilaceae bacterium]|nr:diaminopimelate decarboxylase [Thermoleophilaceae bacterium]